MSFIKKYLPFCALSIGLFQVPSYSMQEQNENTFSEISKINIMSDEGNISIVGSKTRNVDLSYNFVTSQNWTKTEGCQLTIEKKEGTLFLKNSKQNNGGVCYMKLAIPEDIPVRIELGSGDCDFSHLTKEISFKVGYGKLKGTDNSGLMKVGLGSGVIDLTYNLRLNEKMLSDLQIGNGQVTIKAPKNAKIFWPRPPFMMISLQDPFRMLTNEGSETPYQLSLQMGMGSVNIESIDNSPL